MAENLIGIEDVDFLNPHFDFTAEEYKAFIRRSARPFLHKLISRYEAVYNSQVVPLAESEIYMHISSLSLGRAGSDASATSTPRSGPAVVPDWQGGYLLVPFRPFSPENDPVIEGYHSRMMRLKPELREEIRDRAERKFAKLCSANLATKTPNDSFGDHIEAIAQYRLLRKLENLEADLLEVDAALKYSLNFIDVTIDGNPTGRPATFSREYSYDEFMHRLSFFKPNFQPSDLASDSGPLKYVQDTIAAIEKDETKDDATIERELASLHAIANAYQLIAEQHSQGGDIWGYRLAACPGFDAWDFDQQPGKTIANGFDYADAMEKIKEFQTKLQWGHRAVLHITRPWQSRYMELCEKVKKMAVMKNHYRLERFHDMMDHERIQKRRKKVAIRANLQHGGNPEPEEELGDDGDSDCPDLGAGPDVPDDDDDDFKFDDDNDDEFKLDD